MNEVHCTSTVADQTEANITNTLVFQSKVLVAYKPVDNYERIRSANLRESGFVLHDVLVGGEQHVEF